MVNRKNSLEYLWLTINILDLHKKDDTENTGNNTTGKARYLKQNGCLVRSQTSGQNHTRESAFKKTDW